MFSICVEIRPWGEKTLYKSMKPSDIYCSKTESQQRRVLNLTWIWDLSLGRSWGQMWLQQGFPKRPLPPRVMIMTNMHMCAYLCV